MMLDWVGLSSTFFSIGAFVSAVGLINQLILSETAPRVVSGGEQRHETALSTKVTSPSSTPSSPPPPPPSPSPSSLSIALGSFREAASYWRTILGNNSEARVLCLSQMTFWFALSGAQMTLLPLFLADHFSLSPTNIGYV